MTKPRGGQEQGGGPESIWLWGGVEWAGNGTCTPPMKDCGQGGNPGWQRRWWQQQRRSLVCVAKRFFLRMPWCPAWPPPQLGAMLLSLASHTVLEEMLAQHPGFSVMEGEAFLGPPEQGGRFWGRPGDLGRSQL